VGLSYIAPGVAVRDAGTKGRGLFAQRPFEKGDTIAACGGRVVEYEEFSRLGDELRTHSLQIDDALFLVCDPDFEPVDFLNHSCEPNVGMRGNVLFVALRAVEAGEELCYDYAMSDTNDYDEFVCACDMPSCRRLITGGDWKLPELQERYRGYFSTYIERKISVAVEDS
jgi:SET domain-containing protein